MDEPLAYSRDGSLFIPASRILIWQDPPEDWMEHPLVLSMLLRNIAIFRCPFHGIIMDSLFTLSLSLQSFYYSPVNTCGQLKNKPPSNLSVVPAEEVGERCLLALESVCL